jgi:hypothetical protein
LPYSADPCQRQGVVGGVVRRLAVLGNRNTVAGCVVDILSLAAVRLNYRGELADGVVTIGRFPVQGGHAADPAEDIVSVVEARVDRPVRCVVDQVKQFAGRVILIRSVRTVAEVFTRQVAGSIVGVADNQGAVAVVQASQPASSITNVMHREATLVDALRPPAAGVIAELQELAVRIGHLGEPIGRIVLERRGAVLVVGTQQVTVAVIGIAAKRAVGVDLNQRQALGIGSGIENLASAVDGLVKIAPSVITKTFAAAVGIMDGQQIAVAVVTVAGGIAAGVRQAEQVPLPVIGHLHLVAQRVRLAHEVAQSVVLIGVADLHRHLLGHRHLPGACIRQVTDFGRRS